MRLRPLFAAALLLPALAAPGSAQPAEQAAETTILPPALPWDGASRSLIAKAGDPWITAAEASGFRTTPSYAETIAWLRRLDVASPQVALVSLGKSGEGRELWMAVVSAEGAATPEALRANGKPTLLAQGGIHAGEIDGKDAGLMLLRDLTVGGSRRALLERANLLFLPIFNVDGHERSSRFGRINQRGPEAMGWRTTARNLNLNRDYAKLDAPETRRLVAALETWQPDLYADLHVTDGIDYQYDITWGHPGRHGYSPAIAGWLAETLTPALTRDLAAQGHIPGPLVFAADPEDLARGLVAWTATPRFSDGYGAARHLPAVLVENHSLKPYEQRVLGTYVLVAGMLESLGRHGAGLRAAVAADRGRRPAEVPLSWKASEAPPATVEFKGVGFRHEPSAVSGGRKVVWTGEPQTLRLPRIVLDQVEASVRRPAAYWVPAAWGEVIERLGLHGIRMERLAAPREVEVTMYRVADAKIDPEPVEGRVHVTATPTPEKRRETFPAGSVRVPTDQPLGDLAVLLLEPASGDSFFQWGFFLPVLQRTEYVEAYVMEPMAERMLAEDPALKAEFDKALAADPALAANPQERLQWLYRRTPFFDERWRLYPVGREELPGK
jgi:murein tripeptide amidase MpaA